MKPLDVLFLASPPSFPFVLQEPHKAIMPPLGLGYMATVLKNYDYNVSIIDMYHSEVTMSCVLEQLNTQKVRMVGISCTTDTYNNAVRIAGIIKSHHPDCIIVFGGPHVSFEYEAALKTEVVDFVVINEGENG